MSELFILLKNGEDQILLKKNVKDCLVDIDENKNGDVYNEPMCEFEKSVNYKSRKSNRNKRRKSDLNNESESLFKLGLRKCLSSIPIIVLLFGLSYLFGNSISNGVPKNIGGYVPMTVLTRSMQSVYPQNSFVVAKEVNPKTLKIGDDITYLKENNTTVTHRIVGITENYNGTNKRAFETKGVNNQKKDEKMVISDNVIGKIVFHDNNIGMLILFVKENIILTLVFLFVSIYLFETVVAYIYSVIKKSEGDK